MNDRVPSERRRARREMICLPDGTVVDAIVGYRGWRARPSNGEVDLQSMFRSQCRWPKRGLALKRADPYTGRTTVFPPRIGVRSSGEIGIHAFNAPEDLFWLNVTYSRLESHPWIIGEVHLWGEVHVHEKGYRAEFARPAAIYVYPDAPKYPMNMLAELAALQYGIPTVRYHDVLADTVDKVILYSVAVNEGHDQLAKEIARMFVAEDGERDT